MRISDGQFYEQFLRGLQQSRESSVDALARLASPSDSSDRAFP